ncbi:hypothetical protein OAF34_06200, partial [Pirellulaceae bacterium]|nr:hypothetical protein [Pirellulaceae bacterium]
EWLALSPSNQIATGSIQDDNSPHGSLVNGHVFRGIYWGSGGCDFGDVIALPSGLFLLLD